MGSSRSAGDDDRVIRIGGQEERPPVSPLLLLGRVEHVVVDSKVFNIKLIGKYKRLENGSMVHVIGTTTFEGWVGEIMEYDSNSRCIVRFYSTNKIPTEVKQGDAIWYLNEIADYDDAFGVNDIELFYDASGGGSSSNVIPQERHQMVTPPGGGFLYPWIPVQGGLSSPRVPSGQGNYQSSSDQRQGGIGYYGNLPPYDGSGSSSNVILQGHHQMVTPPGGGFLYPSIPVQGGLSSPRVPSGQGNYQRSSDQRQGGISYYGNVLPPYAGSGSSSNVIPPEYHQMVTPTGGGFLYPSSSVQGGFSFQHQNNPAGLLNPQVPSGRVIYQSSSGQRQGGIGYLGNVPHAGSGSNVIPQEYFQMAPQPGGLLYTSSQSPLQGMPNYYPSPGIGTPSQHTAVPRNSREQVIMPPNHPRQISGNQNLQPDNPKSDNQS